MHTSEDNASFEAIMEATRQRHREKYFWIYKKEGADGDQLLMLEGIMRLVHFYLEEGRRSKKKKKRI
jgi:hypothetical protein